MVIYYLFLLNAARDNSRSILYYMGIAGFTASVVNLLTNVYLNMPVGISTNVLDSTGFEHL
jgi:hypothetical protein